MCEVRVKKENLQKVSEALTERGFSFTVSEDTRKCWSCLLEEEEDGCCRHCINVSFCKLHQDKVMLNIKELSGRKFHKLLFEIGVVPSL